MPTPRVVIPRLVPACTWRAVASGSPLPSVSTMHTLRASLRWIKSLWAYRTAKKSLVPPLGVRRDRASRPRALRSFQSFTRLVPWLNDSTAVATPARSSTSSRAAQHCTAGAIRLRRMELETSTTSTTAESTPAVSERRLNTLSLTLRRDRAFTSTVPAARRRPNSTFAVSSNRRFRLYRSAPGTVIWISKALPSTCAPLRYRVVSSQ